MRKTIYILVPLLAFIWLLVEFIIPQGKNTLKHGVYDPNSTFLGIKMDYELSYFSWDNDVDSISETIQRQIKNGRVPIVTLEPWPSFPYENGDVLKETSNGSYDSLIISLCTTLSNVNSEIILRWGHEMEMSGHRYPWSNKDPNLYKNAYTHFVSKCREKDVNKTISFMWSPSGEKKSKKYWPGKEFVDIIGVSVYSYDEWDEINLGEKRSFSEVFNPKYARLVTLGKPILITEMGVTGIDEYKVSWLSSMKWQLQLYPKVIGYIYFNSRDVEGAWGTNIDTPDWRLPDDYSFSN